MKTASWFLLLAMLAAAPLWAGDKPVEPGSGIPDLTLEQLMEVKIATVNGACKFEQKVTDAPASVTVITAEEIKLYGYRTLADILRSVRGFYTGYDRNYGYLGTRGFSRPGDFNSRFMLLVDGHRVNDPIYGTAAVGTEFILDVDLIERVEVIRGASSSLYGTSAFFGVINVITRHGNDIKGGEISGSAGSPHTYGGRLSYGNRYPSGLDVVVSGTGYDSRGERDLYYGEYDNPADNHGIAHRVDDDRSYSLFSKFSWRDLTFTGAYVSREKGIPTGSYGTVFNDSRNRTWDKSGFTDLRYERPFENGSNLTARAYFDDYRYRGDYLYSGADPGDPPVLMKDYADGQAVGGELMYIFTLPAGHRVSLGAEGRSSFREDQGNYDESPYFNRLDDQRNSSSYAFFAQDEYHILKNLILNAGLRHDHYNTFGGSTNPRLALIFKPLDKTILKILYGSAFRAPTPYEMYYADNDLTMKANPDIEPEKIRTYEAAYEQYIGENLRTSLSGFYYRIDNLITQVTDPDDLLVFRNIGKVEAKGMEMELEGKWSSGAHARVSYLLQEATDEGTGERLTNSPRHLVKLNMAYPLLSRKLFASGEVQYTSKRKTLAGEESGFALANLTLFSRDWIKGLEVSLSFYNLLDRKYGDPGAGEHLQDVIEQDGRTWRLKLTYRF